MIRNLKDLIAEDMLGIFGGEGPLKAEFFILRFFFRSLRGSKSEDTVRVDRALSSGRMSLNRRSVFIQSQSSKKRLLSRVVSAISADNPVKSTQGTNCKGSKIGVKKERMRFLIFFQGEMVLQNLLGRNKI